MFRWRQQERKLDVFFSAKKSPRCSPGDGACRRLGTWWGCYDWGQDEAVFFLDQPPPSSESQAAKKMEHHLPALIYSYLAGKKVPQQKFLRVGNRWNCTRTLAARGLEEPFFQLCCCVSFWSRTDGQPQVDKRGLRSLQLEATSISCCYNE